MAEPILFLLEMTCPTHGNQKAKCLPGGDICCAACYAELVEWRKTQK